MCIYIYIYIYIYTVCPINLVRKSTNGRPKARWKDVVENNVRNMGIVNWRQVAQDRDRWMEESK